MREPSTEPFGTPKTDLPRSGNLKNLGGTLLKPWWNLPRKLLAEQDGSAPENSRESESNFAPKPLAEDPKAIAVGESTANADVNS